MQWIWLKKSKEITSKFGLWVLFTKPLLIKLIELVLKGQRGAGIEQSLPIFDKLKKEFNIPILTDIHNAEQCSLSCTSC